MKDRSLHREIREALGRQAAVALLGPRQTGKTTLALEIAREFDALYLDLESTTDLEKLASPELFLTQYQNRLVVLDEIHRIPSLFPSLRGLIDQGRREGHRTARFLILGSASLNLLRQSGESLAGRIEYVELTPFHVLEVDPKELLCLWVRGGFPESFLAPCDGDSLRLRQNLIKTYLERDIPQFGPRVPAQTMQRLWTMLAHSQGALLNASKLSASLAVSGTTVTHYIDLLADLMLVRRLPAHHANVKKRLVKSPRTYLRDSGFVHALLQLPDYESLTGHPVVGASWEGFVIENLLAVSPPWTFPSFYRTAAGAEIDLVLEHSSRQELWAIEIKLGMAPKVSKGFRHALEDLKPARAFVVYSGTDRYPLAPDVEAIGLREMACLLRDLQADRG